MLPMFFVFSNRERAAPQLENPGEPSGADEHPCSVMRHKGKMEFIGVYWSPYLCSHHHHQGKRQAEGTLKKFEKLFVRGTVSLWIELISTNRAWAVKVWFGFCCLPSPR